MRRRGVKPWARHGQNGTNRQSAQAVSEDVVKS